MEKEVPANVILISRKALSWHLSLSHNIIDFTGLRVVGKQSRRQLGKIILITLQKALMLTHPVCKFISV